MENTAHRAIAIVGAGAVLPDAVNVSAFWDNVKSGRYSISDVSPERWDPALYYDSDHAAPDKTYSKIGGWVRQFRWEPMKWHLPIPPRVVEGMDDAQKWAIACTREALEDYGYPQRPLDLDRTAVILGNAMAGEKHYLTSLRLFFPEYAGELEASPSFAALPEPMRRQITEELHRRMCRRIPEITEDTMPGELANCIAGRIANLYNFHGPNFVCDAACASAMAALSAAVEGLIEHDFDAVVTGGIDRNMGAPTFVKFCKIGALSGTGTRPYAEGADGFVMGEGAAIFILKRLADAERDGDKIYALIRGIGGSSDGKGKGITAPNPIGQKFCVERAWKNAGLSPATATLIEGHGTSTRVGDVVEVEGMANVLTSSGARTRSVALGSVKSNIGHLKGAAGAAGLLKASLALRDKVLPPSLHCARPNPGIDFDHSPLYVNTELRPWTETGNGARRVGVSAFGFGGTNFHIVLEEHIPGKLTGNGKRAFAVGDIPSNAATVSVSAAATEAFASKMPVRGALVIGAASSADLMERLRTVLQQAEAGQAPAPAAPAAEDLRAPERLAIDYGDAAELADKAEAARKALAANQPAIWKALRARGIFRGHGPAPKVAFLYTGQGSQYVNMFQTLRATEPIVANTFAEADRVLTPLLGKPLSQFIFVDDNDPAAVARAEDDLRQTAITQPAVLTADLAITRLLAAFGIQPDMVMGHSMGEYGALVAAGALPFEDALEAVSARGREMTRVSMADNGTMAAVFAPLSEVERLLATVNGYVVIANINSEHQAVIGGASTAVEEASQVLLAAGYNVVQLSVSHAFHTSIVALASEPLRAMLQRLRVQSPRLPIVANVNGEFYPTGPGVESQMADMLARQVAAPVQFVKGLRTLYAAGARVFVEVGPKKALQGFAEDVLGERGDVLSLFTNHPKLQDAVAFNQALCGMYAAGLGLKAVEIPKTAQAGAETPDAKDDALITELKPGALAPDACTDYAELGRIVAEALERSGYHRNGEKPAATFQPVVITGAALGLPGSEHIFDDGNIARILRGQQFITAIPPQFQQAMLDKNITRLVKSENGGPTFEAIHELSDAIKLAARGQGFDPEKEFGVSAERIAALDSTTSLAIAVGLEALRDAGIPLVLRYKTTTKGTQLPERWGLPDALRDETGIIFGSAFPGLDSFAEIMSAYHADRARRQELASLETLRAQSANGEGHSVLAQELNQRIAELRAEIEKRPFIFDRRFLFRVLSMGHSQFAEFIGARGPNTQINAACATTAQAVSLAEDWIRAGRCRRVIVISSDNVTSDNLIEWMGAGFLASGAAATDEAVEEAAIPFDRRRHGLIMGMGAAALVVESADAARERGVQPICDVLSSVTANSAFHGTRLDVRHIGQVMEDLLAQAERRTGIDRKQIAPHTVFVSHETYTPARGGSASAEIYALRKVFGETADQIIIANTKGFTGHAMATGIEDVVAVKVLETGIVPPVANFKEVDPELGSLNLSKGGSYPVEYAIHLGAGFGSQISMTLLRWAKTKDGQRRSPEALGYEYRIADSAVWGRWLTQVAGHPAAELEVVHRTLRIRDRATVAREASQTAAQSMATPSMATVATQQPQQVSTVAGPAAAEIKPQPKAAAAAASVAATPTPAVPQQVAAPAPAFVQPSPPAAQKTKTATNADADSVKQRILALVSEKTGYPIDMLDLDLDLEADLGIDTVKQAEVFASVREAYGIPRDENMRLRDFPTLAHVIEFANSRRASAPPPTATQQPPTTQATVAEPPVATPQPEAPEVRVAVTATADAVRETVLALVVEKTGYPTDMLDLDLDLEADLGIDTVKQAEMFAAIRETYNIRRDENRKLRDYPTLAHVIRFVFEQRPDLASTVPTAAPPRAAEAPAPPTAQTGTDDEIKNKVLEIVAEKTGYPPDMLDLDLDLEADLGIDTVKQAEMFAAIRAAYNIPRDENLKLRDFPTLAHVIGFARDRRAEVTAPSSTGATSQSGTTTTLASPVVATPVVRPKPASFDAADRVPRRVPLPVLRPPLSLCKPTGVVLGTGSRVVVMPDKGGAGDALAEELQAKGVEVLFVQNATEPDALADNLERWLAAGAVQGVYWLAALDDEASISQMDLTAWRSALQVRVKSLYTTMRTLHEHIATPGTFLVSATRLGGQHGYDDAGASAPLGGSITGFTKAYKREHPDALVRAVDFATHAGQAEIAQSLIAEAICDPGAVEVGYKDGLRWSVGLQERPLVDGQPAFALNSQSVFLVTGAAGSIVSAITADLAAASGGTFYLLDLVPEPDPNSADLKRFVTDKDGLKRELFAGIQARGERATPALVEKELAALERAQAANAAIDAVRAAGGTAHYFSVNLSDAAAVAKVIEQVRQRSGRIDVLLHAAGIERSHFLADKEPREFDLVFDVKADGWFNLLKAIGDMPLGATVAFSSVAGRFGNAGQTDYSAANDLLCKFASNFRRTRPATRAIVIDWTAWGGIGMATRGSIPKMMELAGIDMLPPDAGIPVVRRELTSGFTGEIVIANRLGVLLNEWDSTGGLDIDAVQASVEHRLPVRGPMVGKVTGMYLHRGLTMETALDPASQPFLYDHRIDGTPVLPGVMGIEAFAEAALCAHPGWYVEAVEEVNFLAPFKFYRDEPRTLLIEAICHPEGSSLVTDCRLIGRRTLPNQPQPQETLHFTARVRLTRETPAAVTGRMMTRSSEAVVNAAEIYHVYFHGPAYRVLESAWWDGEHMVGVLAHDLPKNHQHSEQPTLMAPRLIELCFQTAGLWEMGVQRRYGLPNGVHDVSLLRAPSLAEGQLCAIVTPHPEQGTFDAEVVDAKGNCYVRLNGYRTAEVPGSADGDRFKALQEALAPEAALV